MPIEAPSGTLDIENAKLRVSEFSATTSIGIGTENTQTHPLYIYKASEPEIVLQEGTTAAAKFTSNAGSLIIQSGVTLSDDSNGDIVFSDMGVANRRMTIKGATGNVGIATTSPVSKCQIAGQTVISENISTQNSARVYDAELSVVREIGYYSSGTAEIDIGATTSAIGNYTSTYKYKLYTDVAGGTSKFKIASVAGPSGTYNGYGTNTDRITLDNEGKVGIGTASPEDNLHIHASEAGGTQLKIQNTYTTGDSRAGLFLQTRN